MSRRIACLVALILVSAACSSGAETPPTTTTVPSSTTSSQPSGSTTTTTTTIPPVGFSPLNGLPIYEDELFERRAIGVKIDNSRPAHPQSGIQNADAIVELLVEDRVTRFIAFFHGSDTDYIGPIRSLRPSDVQVALPLGATMVYTGGQPWVTGPAASQGLERVTFTDDIMYRIADRVLPHNVYGSTLDFRANADERGNSNDLPLSWFSFGEWPLPTEPATTVTIEWTAPSHVEWRYDEATHVYKRWANDSEHEWVDIDGERGQVEAEVLVVLSVRPYIANVPSGFSGSAVPAVDSVGSGDAWIFSKGRAWLGTWERDSASEPFRLLDEFGHPANVPAGRLWVSLYPNTQTFQFD